MAEVGLNEAARQFAVPKTTLLRASRDGRLSSTMRDGRRLFDTAELARWSADRPAPVVRSTRNRESATDLHAEVDRLRAEVDRLRSELDRERDERRELERQARAERDRLIGLVERTTTRLLAAPVSLVESVLPSWLTGRS